MRRTLAAALAAALALASLGSFAACDVNRSGTLSSGNGVTLNSCSGAAASTDVTWSGQTTSSVRVTYRNGATNSRTGWVAASGTASGTVSVAVPATAASSAWTVYKVELASAANGGGTKTSVTIDCATAVTTTTATPTTAPPTTTQPPTTTTEPPTTTTEPPTTAPACSVAPRNILAPSLTSDASWVYADEGTWDAGSNCSIVRSENHWERSFNYGAWLGFSGVNDPYEPKNCKYRYRVTVVKWNQFGGTEGASAEIGPWC